MRAAEPRQDHQPDTGKLCQRQAQWTNPGGDPVRHEEGTQNNIHQSAGASRLQRIALKKRPAVTARELALGPSAAQLYRVGHDCPRSPSLPCDQCTGSQPPSRNQNTAGVQHHDGDASPVGWCRGVVAGTARHSSPRAIGDCL